MKTYKGFPVTASNITIPVTFRDGDIFADSIKFVSAVHTPVSSTEIGVSELNASQISAEDYNTLKAILVKLWSDPINLAQLVDLD